MKTEDNSLEGFFVDRGRRVALASTFYFLLLFRSKRQQIYVLPEEMKLPGGLLL